MKGRIMMFCGHCGKSLKENTRFCTGCGINVVKTTETSHDTLPIGEIQSGGKAVQHKSLMFAILAVVLAIVSSAVFLYIQNRDAGDIGCAFVFW